MSFEDAPDIKGYDLVHGFGLRPTELRACRQKGLPIALSTIYNSRAYTTGKHESGRQVEKWKFRSRMGLVLLRSALQGKHLEKCEAVAEWVQHIQVRYEMADILLPNSHLEAETIQREVRVTTPMHVVPNAVDHRQFIIEEQDLDARKGVLFAGRFEPHKNQLGLIEAMRGSDIPMVLVGPPHPDHNAYYQECRRRATKNITLLPGVPHDELASLYNAAKVHVLPSWYETTGLVSLEAALCGCNVVTTERGFTREYFQDMAWYCDPSKPSSISHAVEEAYRSEFRVDLQKRILENFTWEHTAQATVEAYTKVLSAR